MSQMLKPKEKMGKNGESIVKMEKSVKAITPRKGLLFFFFPASGTVQGETPKLGSGRAWTRARSRAYMKTRVEVYGEGVESPKREASGQSMTS